MDYTQSDSFDTDVATGHRYHEDTKPIPTIWSAKDANSIIWSLMSIINAAGLVPKQFDKNNPDSYGVLLAALSRVGVFATPPSSDNSTRAATTAFVRSLFKSSLMSGGSQEIAGGLIIKWGFQPSAAGANTVVTFPVAFPNECFHVQGTGQNVSASFQSYVTLNSFSKTGAVFNCFNGQGGTAPVLSTTVDGVRCNWAAFGY